MVRMFTLATDLRSVCTYVALRFFFSCWFGLCVCMFLFVVLCLFVLIICFILRFVVCLWFALRLLLLFFALLVVISVIYWFWLVTCYGYLDCLYIWWFVVGALIVYVCIRIVVFSLYLDALIGFVYLCWIYLFSWFALSLLLMLAVGNYLLFYCAFIWLGFYDLPLDLAGWAGFRWLFGVICLLMFDWFGWLFSIGLVWFYFIFDVCFVVFVCWVLLIMLVLLRAIVGILIVLLRCGGLCVFVCLLLFLLVWFYSLIWFDDYFDLCSVCFCLLIYS